SADRAHAVVDSARPQTPLGNLETPALAQQHVAVRHSHVFKYHLRMAMGSIIITKHRQRADHLDAGGVHGYKDHRVLLMARSIRIGQSHEDHDLAARVTGTGGPPLATVDDPLVTLAAGVGLHVGGVG